MCVSQPSVAPWSARSLQKPTAAALACSGLSDQKLVRDGNREHVRGRQPSRAHGKVHAHSGGVQGVRNLGRRAAGLSQPADLHWQVIQFPVILGLAHSGEQQASRHDY